MYRFPLQKVLDYRKKKEELAQQKLAVALQEREQARFVLQKTEEEFTDCQRVYTDIQSTQTDLARLMQAADYTGLLAKQLEARQEELLAREIRLLEEKRQTEQAMQSRKIIDKLRQKDYSRYLQEMNKAEQKQLDEIARLLFLQQD
ncbi:MAG TPA: flagellar export protein FliJ [Firmicutes bacterium]|jgi:flagellar FliJ protein|nr:flagellar export protein FliJ [Bacillota bacterium]